jgi:hypothetical protein
MATPEWETREARVERWVPHGAHIVPLAFRSGGGLTALLQDSPRATFEFTFSNPAWPLGGVLTQDTLSDTPNLGLPSDIVGVTRDGVPWYLDRQTGRVVSETISSRRELIATLDTVGTVRSACALGGRAIAYVTAQDSAELFVRDLATGSTNVVAFPPPYAGRWSVRWSDVRFGGSLNGQCVLWSSRMSTAMLVSDSAVRLLGPFVEPVRPEAWYRRLARWITRVGPPVYALDATSFPGGIAVLFGGHTAGAGRMVDLYSDSGAYLETMVLPRPALRVAGNDARLFVLSESLDSILLASYILPAAVRSRAQPTDTETTKIDIRLPPKWLRDSQRSRGDSVMRRR